MFVLMTDIKTQLSNVAFGGSWSEEILNTSYLEDALLIISQAAQDCTEMDVRTPELDEALAFIRSNIGRGPELCSQFMKAVCEPNQALRRQQAMRIVKSIRQWSNGAMEQFSVERLE